MSPTHFVLVVWKGLSVCFVGVDESVFWCVCKSCGKHENQDINGSGSDECMNDGGYSVLFLTGLF